MKIPSYINTQKLNLKGSTRPKEGVVKTELRDPEGDRVVFTRTTRQTGNTCLTPETKVEVQYGHKAGALGQIHRPSSEEAQGLVESLRQAQSTHHDEQVGWLLSDLHGNSHQAIPPGIPSIGKTGGGGRACVIF